MSNYRNQTKVIKIEKRVWFNYIERQDNEMDNGFQKWLENIENETG